MSDLPLLPDNDMDFTPELAREIVSLYRDIVIELQETALKLGGTVIEYGEKIKTLERMIQQQAVTIDSYQLLKEQIEAAFWEFGEGEQT